MHKDQKRDAVEITSFNETAFEPTELMELDESALEEVVGGIAGDIFCPELVGCGVNT